MPQADFVSIGSNDLVQFLTAADRANTLVSKRYDPIALPRLRALNHIVDGAALQRSAHHVRRTRRAVVEALALMSIGMTRLSMGPPSVGPIKEMILGIDLKPIAGRRRMPALERRAPIGGLAFATCCCEWVDAAGSAGLWRLPADAMANSPHRRQARRARKALRSVEAA